jgi:hypothetical protein
MTEIKTYCDKCGAETTSMSDYEDTDIEINHYYKRVDLCALCFEKLTDMVENFFSKESEGTE